MYRNRASSNFSIKLIPSLFSNLNPLLNSSSSSFQNPFFNSIKTPPLGQPWWIQSFSVAAQRFNFSLDRSDPANSQQNSRITEAQQWSSPRFGGQFNQMNNWDNLGRNGKIDEIFDRNRSSSDDDKYPFENQKGFFGGEHHKSYGHGMRISADGRIRDDGKMNGNFKRHCSARDRDEYPFENQSGFFGRNHREADEDLSIGCYVDSDSDSNGSCQQNSFKFDRRNSTKLQQNEHHQWNSNTDSSIRNRIAEFERDPRISDRYNQMDNAQNFAMNSNPRVPDECPYDENQNGFFRENHKEMHQEPTGQYDMNPRQHYQYPYNHQSEIISFDDALYKLDEFCKESKVKEAIATFTVLEKLGIAIDVLRYLKLVQVCGEAKSLENARVVHDHLSHTLGDVKVCVHNKILEMYSKSGSIPDAYELFEKMPCRNLSSWETMIRGLSDNGLGEEAIDLFTEFKEIGLKPDAGLFATIIYTCGVLGAIDQGMLYFESMRTNFSIAPDMEHYITIVDMFGRNGYLDEALEFIESMPIEPNIEIWETLMKFCRVNGYTELGDRCANIIEQTDSSRLTRESKMGLLPVLASEITKEKQREIISELPDIKRQVVEYKAGDRSHAGNEKLYEQIQCLARQAKEAGYVPDMICALHDVDQESREEALLYHSERLAAVHVLMTTPARSPIRIIKNLRVCKDCHNFLKILSKLVGRQIIARDIKRFHHFGDGVCSCNDFW